MQYFCGFFWLSIDAIITAIPLRNLIEITSFLAASMILKAKDIDQSDNTSDHLLSL
jgi:hypothetical protein